MAVTASEPLAVAVIVGSTREHRRADKVVRWLMGELEGRDDMAVDVIDLAEVALPAVLPHPEDPVAVAFKQRIAAADAFIVVVPEYNHGYPASVKQAIDIPHREWFAKAVAFVTYGGLSGGIRAAEQLRQVFAEVRAFAVRDQVAFPRIQIDDDGIPAEVDYASRASAAMLTDLVWWGLALREAREARPYRS